MLQADQSLDDARDQAPLPPQPSNSLLLKIPMEVRYMIFEYLVPRGKAINIRGLRTPNSSDFGALCLVNKQIYSEASHLFYTNNHFVIGNGPFGSIG